MIKQSLFAAMLVASLGTAVSQTAAAADIGLVINVAPPPLRVETAPAARRGYVWTPGYWNWRNNRHVWVAGRYVRERPGYVYAAPIWVDRGGRWEMQRGAWSRHDRDGDGIPNAKDRDRDGDGVRNGRDHKPDNPRRY